MFDEHPRLMLSHKLFRWMEVSFEKHPKCHEAPCGAFVSEKLTFLKLPNMLIWEKSILAHIWSEYQPKHTTHLRTPICAPPGIPDIPGIMTFLASRQNLPSAAFCWISVATTCTLLYLLQLLQFLQLFWLKFVIQGFYRQFWGSLKDVAKKE